MKKFFWFLSITAFIALFLPAAPAAARTAPNADYFTDNYQVQIFTATVTLLDITVDKYSLLLKIELPNGEAEVFASMFCPFIDSRQNSVSYDEFLELYKGKRITIDFQELEPGLYQVNQARAGLK